MASYSDSNRRMPQFAAAEATLMNARQDLARQNADREGAKQQRGNIRLEAPADGVVTSPDAEPGSTVVAGQAVLKLIDPTSLRVTTRLDQGRSAGLQLGLPAEITLRSKGRNPFAGKLVRIEPNSERVTEERIAEVAFDSLPQGVTTGEMVEVTLHLPTIRDTLVIPNAALRYRGSTAGVWRRADGRLRFVPVKVGAEGLDGKVQKMASQYQTAIIVVTHGEKIIPTFRRLDNIRDGRTFDEAGVGRALV